MNEMLLTSVITIAASSHPVDLVILTLTHRRNPTLTYEKTRSVKDRTQSIRPSRMSSSVFDFVSAIFAYPAPVRKGGVGVDSSFRF